MLKLFTIILIIALVLRVTRVRAMRQSMMETMNRAERESKYRGRTLVMSHVDAGRTAMMSQWGHWSPTLERRYKSLRRSLGYRNY